MKTKLPKHVHGYTRPARQGAATTTSAPAPRPCPCTGLPWSPRLHGGLQSSRMPPTRGQDTVPPGATAAIARARSMLRWSSYYEQRNLPQGAGERARKARSAACLERWRRDRGELPLQAAAGRSTSSASSRNWNAPSVPAQHAARDPALHQVRRRQRTDRQPIPPPTSTRAKMAKTGGFYTWTEEDVAAFKARHPSDRRRTWRCRCI